MSTGPVEAKVKAGSFGAALGGLIVWVLETYAYPDGVPQPVQVFLNVAIAAAMAWLFAYQAKHTFRNDPDATNSQESRPTT